MKKAFILLGILFFSVMVAPVLAQGAFDQFYSTSATSYFWTTVLGLPSDWLTPNAFLFNFALPFIALYAIVYGFLRMLQIFTKNIRYLLAFVISFLTLPSLIFVTIVQYTLALAGAFAYFAFLFIFFGGIYWISRGFVWRHEGVARQARNYAKMMKSMQKDQTGYYRKVSDLRNEISDLERELAETDINDDAARNRLTARINVKHGELTDAEADLEKIRDKIKSFHSAHY